MSATNQVVENKLEPITKAEPTQQLVVTGQYLYDLFFVQAEEASLSRMEQIRELVTKADSVQIQGATDKMVALANKADIAAGMPEKVMIDGKERKNRGSKQRSAMNVRTNIRNIWGAMKYASFDGLCGYQEACVRSREALDSANLLWNGGRKPTQADRDNRKALKEQKAQTEALLEATKETPRALNESFESWQARIAQKALASVEMARQEANEAQGKALYESILSKGDGVAFEVFKLLADKFGYDVSTEMSDEEAEQMLAAAAADGAVEIHSDDEVVTQ